MSSPTTLSVADLPPEIREHVEVGTILTTHRLRLGNHIAYVEDLQGRGAVLKVGSGRSGSDIRAEAERIAWIGERLPVARVLVHASRGDQEFLLLRKLPGRPAYEMADALGPESIVRIFANLLRRIHAISLDNCPFPQVIAQEFEDAVRNTRAGLIDEAAFFQEVGDLPASVLSKLERRMTPISENTFTHADYCLPNVIVDSDGEGSVIDWGLAGVSNVNRDFMSAELTIRRNLGADLVPLFYREYGTERPTDNLIEYFWLLDRFSNHLRAE